MKSDPTAFVTTRTNDAREWSLRFLLICCDSSPKLLAACEKTRLKRCLACANRCVLKGRNNVYKRPSMIGNTCHFHLLLHDIEMIKHWA